MVHEPTLSGELRHGALTASRKNDAFLGTPIVHIPYAKR
jgi:hypothetical protein